MAADDLAGRVGCHRQPAAGERGDQRDCSGDRVDRAAEVAGDERGDLIGKGARGLGVAEQFGESVAERCCPEGGEPSPVGGCDLGAVPGG